MLSIFPTKDSACWRTRPTLACLIPDKLKAVLEQLHNRDEKEGKDDDGDGEYPEGHA